MGNKKNVKRGNHQEEQILLLRQILEELRTLNSTVAATKLAMPPQTTDLEVNAENVDNSEELDYFE